MATQVSNEGEEGELKRRRLVLVPFPAQGHVTPFLQLASMLHSTGSFSITIAHTVFNSPDASSYPHLQFFPIDDGLAVSDISAVDVATLMATINANCTSPLRDFLLEARDSESESPCVVIYDGVMYCAEAVAADLELPSLLLNTCSAVSSLAYGALPRLVKQGLIPHPDSKVLDVVPELHPIRYKDLPITNLEQLQRLFQLAPDIGNPRTSSAIIYNTMEFLEPSSLQHYQKLYRIPVFPLGPFHKLAPSVSSSTPSSTSEETICLAWLDKQQDHSVIYICFGTLVTMSETELTETAWGLANSHQHFLWVIRPGSVRGGNSVVPDGFKERVGERGCIVDWAPQKAVLAHRAVGGFLSHCGWNSTLESICEGVPMICRPVAGDQRVNARYLDQVLGVGMELESGLERGEVERAVKRLMQGKEGVELRERALGLKVKATLSMKEGGSYTCFNEFVKFIISL